MAGIVKKLVAIGVDVAAIAGLMAIGIGADKLGERIGVGRSLGWLWFGGVVLAASVLVAREIAQQKGT